jgi:NADH-quinone oxidoreductase subunit F
MIQEMGVALECNKALGRDFTLQGLHDDGFEAVFLGVGAPQGSNIGVPGEDGEGVTEALSFLKTYNVDGTVEVGKRVAVIGGGNSAIDAARTALRLGADQVTILYRRTRAQMPAWAEEIDAAEEERIVLQPLVAPVEIVHDSAGKLVGVKCRPMTLGDYDSSGRRRPVAGRNADFVVECDQVIAAIGQWLDSEPLFNGVSVETTKKGWLKTDKDGHTSVEWIFAGGDAATGPASVVAAIGAGEKAAVSIDTLLTGANHAFWRRDVEVDTAFDPDADPLETPRAVVPELAASVRVGGFDEVELSWAAETAVAEARRCLRCDYGKSCAKTEVNR